MIVALAVAFIVLVVCAIANKEDIRVSTGMCVGFAAITGIANGIVNLLVMVLSAPGQIDASILFPSISGGGIVLGFIMATFVYKEKLSKLQYVGYAIGTASVILLNI
jgi:multidrug transporter EmrE-like cation transporter